MFSKFIETVSMYNLLTYGNSEIRLSSKNRQFKLSKMNFWRDLVIEMLFLYKLIVCKYGASMKANHSIESI
jgi:hypothetical protein